MELGDLVGFDTDFLPSSGPSYGGDSYDHDLGQSDYQNQSEVSISYGTNNSNVSYGHQVNNQQPNYNQNFNQQHHQQQQDQYGDQHAFKEEIKEEAPEVIPVESTREYKNSKPEITISNVVCNYRCRTHLNLRDIALKTKHVIYKRDQGKIMMKIRKPNMMANIWSSGKIVCQGARSEDDAMKGARRFARILSKSGNPNVRVSNYKVVNVLGNCKLPFALDIMRFSEVNAGPKCSYEPELHPAVTFRPSNGTTIKIFSTGALTLLGRNVGLVKEALDLVYPLLYPHRKSRSDFDVDYDEEDEDIDEFH